MNPNIRPLLGEFIGTFTLVFIGTSVATLQGFFDMGPAGWLGISFAFGGTFAVLVLVVGPISGCHLNPAITIPMALSGRMKGAQVPGYVAAQILGAVVASFALLGLLRGIPEYALAEHGLAANGNPTAMASYALVGWELILTALFLFTIFSATREDVQPIASAAAIGGFLFLAHLIGVPLGDASLNPARSLGPAIVETVAGKQGALADVWIFIVGPIAGGILGWILYRLTQDE